MEPHPKEVLFGEGVEVIPDMEDVRIQIIEDNLVFLGGVQFQENLSASCKGFYIGLEIRGKVFYYFFTEAELAPHSGKQTFSHFLS
jgi:hypothetical protein